MPSSWRKLALLFLYKNLMRLWPRFLHVHYLYLLLSFKCRNSREEWKSLPSNAVFFRTGTLSVWWTYLSFVRFFPKLCIASTSCSSSRANTSGVSQPVSASPVVSDWANLWAVSWGGMEDADGYMSGLKQARSKLRCCCLVNVLPSTGLTWFSPRHCLRVV